MKKDEVDFLGMPYDYESIMHYARNTFSKSSYLDTIIPKQLTGKGRPEIGQRYKLSRGDIAQANLLYKCPQCGRTFQDDHGDFTSPTYDFTEEVQSQVEKCEWRITTHSGERLQMTIRNLVRIHIIFTLP